MVELGQLKILLVDDNKARAEAVQTALAQAGFPRPIRLADTEDLPARVAQDLKSALRSTLLQHGTRNPVLCLRIPDQASHSKRLVAGLRQVLLPGGSSPGGSPEEVLARVAQEWRELDRKNRKGEAILGEYRISQGLLEK